MAVSAHGPSAAVIVHLCASALLNMRCEYIHPCDIAKFEYSVPSVLRLQTFERFPSVGPTKGDRAYPHIRLLSIL